MEQQGLDAGPKVNRSS